MSVEKVINNSTNYPQYCYNIKKIAFLSELGGYIDSFGLITVDRPLAFFTSRSLFVG